MKLGELADMLKELAEAEKQVHERKRAINFGGNVDTMRHKREALSDAYDEVNRLRDQDLPNA